MSRNTQTLLYLGPIVNCQPLWLHKFHWLHSAAVTASSCVSLDYHCDCYRTPHQCRCTCMYTYHRTQAPQLTRPLRCQLLSLCFPIWCLDFRYRIRGYRNSWNYLYNMENILQYAKKLSYGKLSVCPLMVVTLSSSLAVVVALCHSAAALPAQQVLAFLRCHCITADTWVDLFDFVISWLQHFPRWHYYRGSQQMLTAIYIWVTTFAYPLSTPVFLASYHDLKRRSCDKLR